MKTECFEFEYHQLLITDLNLSLLLGRRNLSYYYNNNVIITYFFHPYIYVIFTNYSYY